MRRDEDVVGPRRAVPVGHVPAHELDGLGEQPARVLQRREPRGRGEVAGYVDRHEEQVGLLRARPGVPPEQRLVHGHLRGEKVAPAPRVGGHPGPVEARREVVDVDPDAGAGGARGVVGGAGVAERRDEEVGGEGRPQQPEPAAVLRRLVDVVRLLLSSGRLRLRVSPMAGRRWKSGSIQHSS